MDFGFTPQQEALKGELRQYFQDLFPPLVAAEIAAETRALGGVGWGPKARALLDRMAADGWLVMGWPGEYGGRGRPFMDVFLWLEESAYTGVPGASCETGAASVGHYMIAPILMKVGSPEQKSYYLPRIARGEIEFAVGYTEPEAGTDLASLQTRAVAEGDDYVINGHKVYTTHAHSATHVWLAARTDPNLPKHRGISLFVFPVDTPGITVRPLYTMADYRVNEVFYDDVRVPSSSLVGEKNMAWQYIAESLDLQRITMSPYRPLERLLDELVAYAKETRHHGRPLSKDPVVRDTLAALAVEVSVARLLAWRTAWLMDRGASPLDYESAVQKVWVSELQQRLADAGLQLLGLSGQLGEGSDWAPLQGKLQYLARAYLMHTIGGGSNEIQRDIIARRGLGLPRG